MKTAGIERRNVARAWQLRLVFSLVSGCVTMHAIGEDATNPYANDAEAAEQGAALYATSGCIPCHGPNAEGALGPSLVDDKWMKRFSEGMVFRTIRNGRRGTRMIGFGDRLDEAQTWKIVEYLLAQGRANRRRGKP
jgi:mono/diheme cytochrome c family protein